MLMVKCAVNWIKYCTVYGHGFLSVCSFRSAVMIKRCHFVKKKLPYNHMQLEVAFELVYEQIIVYSIYNNLPI